MQLRSRRILDFSELKMSQMSISPVQTVEELERNNDGTFEENRDEFINELNRNEETIEANRNEEPIEANRIDETQLRKTEITNLLATIPEYEPGKNLSMFVTEINHVYRMAQGFSGNFYEYLDALIRNKIRGNARDHISNNNCFRWAEIRDSLIRRYGDQRGEDLLVSDLKNSAQLPGETFISFFDRLMVKTNALNQCISIKYAMQPEWLRFKKLEYAEMTQRIFEAGVLEPYLSHLIATRSFSIEESVNQCQILDNAIRERSFADYVRTNSIPKIEQNLAQPPQYQQNYPLRQNMRPNFQNFQRNSNFQRFPNFRPQRQNDFRQQGQFFRPNFQRTQNSTPVQQ